MANPSASALIHHGKALVFGSVPRKPLRGFPRGRIRIRIRNDEFALVYVKNAAGTVAYYVEDTGKWWEPSHMKEANHRQG